MKYAQQPRDISTGYIFFTTKTKSMRSCIISQHTHMHHTPVRRPNGKACKTLISGVACVGVGGRVRGGDNVKCGVRVQVGPTLRVSVRDGTGCG